MHQHQNNHFQTSFEHFSVVRYLLKWTALTLPVAIAVGSVIALLEVNTKHFK